MAGNLANNNAVDGLSNVKSIALDKTNRTVKVSAGAKETGPTPNTRIAILRKGVGNFQYRSPGNTNVKWGTPIEGHCPFRWHFRSAGSEFLAGLTQLQTTFKCHLNWQLRARGGTVPGGFAWTVQNAGQCGGV